MNVVDANVLLYAVNEDADRHRPARLWLDGCLAGAATVGFSWVAVLAFVRLSTKVGLFPAPLPVADAVAQVEEWLAAPTAEVLEPTARHLSLVGKLLDDVGSGANLVNDAHLAALSIEHRGTVVSYDQGFGRFTGVSWSTPELLGGA